MLTSYLTAFSRLYSNSLLLFFVLCPSFISLSGRMLVMPYGALVLGVHGWFDVIPHVLVSHSISKAFT